MYKHPLSLLRRARELSPAGLYLVSGWSPRGTAIAAMVQATEAHLTQAAHGLRTRHSHLRQDAVAMTHWLVFSLRVLRRLREAA